MEYKGLPVYNITLQDDDDMMIMNSIVDLPAVCKDFLTFNEDEPKKMLFVGDDKEQQIITGVSILADTPIYRIDEFGNGYYVVFQKDEIKKIVERYSKDGNNNLVSFQHNSEVVDGIIMIESYFIDKERGICPKEFADCPDGSWITSYRIEDDELWEEIKSNPTLNGFSIEIISTLEPAKEDQHIEEEPESDEEYEMEMNNWLAELLSWLADEDDIEIAMSKDEKWLVNGDGEYWLDENDNKVPAKCPKCGSPVGVYIKGEPVFLCSECGEYLGVVKFPDDMDFSGVKKKFKRLTSGDVEDIMSKNRKVNITIGKQTLWEQQITSIGTDRNGNRIAVVYDPQHNDWETYKIHDITAIEVTEAECENLVYNNKWETITNDPMLEIDITLPSLGMGKDTFDWCMDRNAYCMIEYNDETEDPATGFRTCIITSWGYTQKSKGNGNECLRVYEVSGDTKTGFDEGRYRFVLTRRIKSFRAVDYVEPSLQAPPLYNGEAQAGTGKRGTMSIVKRTATFPAIKKLNQ